MRGLRKKYLYEPQQKKSVSKVGGADGVESEDDARPEPAVRRAG